MFTIIAENQLSLPVAYADYFVIVNCEGTEDMEFFLFL